MMNMHPFINYGAAVVMAENNLNDVSQITREQLAKQIRACINSFRLKPEHKDLVAGNSVKFGYCDEEKGKPDEGIYLAPSVLAKDKDATKVYAALKKLYEDLSDPRFSKKVDITRSIAPVSGEFASFGRTIGRGKPKTSIEIAAWCLITTGTQFKPCLQANGENLAIIPDLEMSELVDFVNLFNRMLANSVSKDLLFGKIDVKRQKPFRPHIFYGNFPYAPRSNSLGTIALLGAIGRWATEAECIPWANKVLDSLKEKSVYIIGTSTYQTFAYNHFIIDLAKTNQLQTIIDSTYYIILFNKGRRSGANKPDYEKLDLFIARFLTWFNRPAFKDFLSFRAEYPATLEKLFKTYFLKMENISADTVQSARELGKWINLSAYWIAKDEATKDKKTSNYDLIRELKSKLLVEIESSVFSARDGASLVFQALTRVGRLSKTDAPQEAELFLTQAAAELIPLETAKQLVLAFSRLKSNKEPKNMSLETHQYEVGELGVDQDDIENAQE